MAVAALAAMMRFQESAWERATSAPVSFDSNDTGPPYSGSRQHIGVDLIEWRALLLLRFMTGRVRA